MVLTSRDENRVTVGLWDDPGGKRGAFAEERYSYIVLGHGRRCHELSHFRGGLRLVVREADLQASECVTA